MRYNRSRITRYISYEKVGMENVRHIRSVLKGLYDGVDGIADGIAIENGKSLFVIDTGRDNGEITFGVKKRLTIEDDKMRKERMLEINDGAISNGDVSVHISEKIEHTPSNDSGSGDGRKLQKELSTDNRKPADNKGRVFGENGDRGRGGHVRHSRATPEQDRAYTSFAEKYKNC